MVSGSEACRCAGFCHQPCKRTRRGTQRCGYHGSSQGPDRTEEKQKIVYDQVDMAQMSLFDTVQDNDIVEEIKNLDMTNLTPMEAMNILYNLQNKIKNRW